MEVTPIDGFELDIRQLEFELDRVKAMVFRGDQANFFGALMCYQNFIWTDNLPTAAVDGVNFYWNPHWFLGLPMETRKTVIMHELWHIARLDMLRRGSRDPLTWNYACDISINNNLEDEGYSFEGTNPWKDQAYSGWTTEDIYDDLVSKQVDISAIIDALGGDPGDMLEPTEEQKQEQVTVVTQSVHAARMSGGNIPGEVQKILKQFLSPVIPWEAVLWRFFQDLLSSDFTWETRDRRYQDIYLPGEKDDDERLEHLAYFFDTSASVTDPQVIRFNSEVKFVWENFKPKKITLVQFDTQIQDVTIIKDEDVFEELLVKGRGGTCWAPVRQWINENRPTAAIVFTDMGFFDELVPPDIPIPTIWVCIGREKIEGPFGETIHIRG